jgi:hypothetical protein
LQPVMCLGGWVQQCWVSLCTVALQVGRLGYYSPTYGEASTIDSAPALGYNCAHAGRRNGQPIGSSIAPWAV